MSEERAQEAAARAAAAARRAEELNHRRTRLEAGDPATVQDVIKAVEAAHVERSRSDEARYGAGQALLDAAQVAEVLDRAGQYARAEEHRRMAIGVEAEAQAELAAERPETDETGTPPA